MDRLYNLQIAQVNKKQNKNKTDYITAEVTLKGDAKIFINTFAIGTSHSNLTLPSWLGVVLAAEYTDCTHAEG